MLKDQVKITIKSGMGGRGSTAMNLLRASGGDGGRGGNIFMVGSENVYDLSWFDDTRNYKAGRGEDGHKRHKTGSDGEDVVLMVPLVTEVHVNNRTPFRISKHGQKELILPGGRGGYGNITIYKHLEVELNGEPELGRTKDLVLVLKLQSDVIFIGLPNAGKSSMLNALSDAKAKIAAYAFTTLEPQLGLMDGIRLMDLPGLIEGTYTGKGLGTKFVKHTETSKMVVHFVSMEDPDLMASYQSIRTEIQNIDPKLFVKPELVVLTKTDTVEPELVKSAEKLFEKIKVPVLSVSIIDDASIAQLREKIKAMLGKS